MAEVTIIWLLKHQMVGGPAPQSMYDPMPSQNPAPPSYIDLATSAEPSAPGGVKNTKQVYCRKCGTPGQVGEFCSKDGTEL